LSPYRLDFTDPKLTALYLDLKGAGLSDPDLDQGCASINYTHTRSGPPKGANDLTQQSCELFNHVTYPGFQKSYQKFSGETYPLSPTESNPVTRDILQRFDRDIEQWRRENSLPQGTNLALAKHIYQWVLDPAGLNMKSEAANPERNFDEAVAVGRADCSEFFKVLYALFKRVGFPPPAPIFVKINLNGEDVEHVATGLEVEGHTYLVDPYYKSFDAAHRVYTRMSLREYFAWHWINLALDLQKTNPAAAQQAFEKAWQIDPSNPHLYLNRGEFEASLGDSVSARADYLKALKLDPALHGAYNAIGTLDYDAGDFRHALVHYRRAITLQPEKTLYRHNLIMTLVQSSRLKEAQLEYRALIKMDPRERELASFVKVPDPSEY
jgi:tetratricopeptide (TPR) repeat protein